MLIAVLLIDISTDFDTKASIATRNEFIATGINNFCRNKTNCDK